MCEKEDENEYLDTAQCINKLEWNKYKLTFLKYQNI